MAEKEETIVGLPEPDAGGGIYKFLSMLSPTRFSVVEPRRSVVVDDMGGYALVKPGQYAFDSFTTPQIVTSGIDAFKAFMDDPVESAKTGVCSHRLSSLDLTHSPVADLSILHPDPIAVAGAQSL